MQTVYRYSAATQFLDCASPRAIVTRGFGLDRELVHIVDGDCAARDQIVDLLAGCDIEAAAFASASECLTWAGRETPACVILTTRLPDISGLELQRRLAERDNPPVIFIGDTGDAPSAVRAMKAGAIEFLIRPLELPALVATVRAALAQNRRQRQRRAELTQLRERFALLTRREREVLPLIVGGLLNKQAASLLGISEVTLQIHRSQVMRKMQADSFADLVRMAWKLRIPYWRETLPQSDLREAVPPSQRRGRSHNLLQSAML